MDFTSTKIQPSPNTSPSRRMIGAIHKKLEARHVQPQDPTCGYGRIQVQLPPTTLILSPEQSAFIFLWKTAS